MSYIYVIEFGDSGRIKVGYSLRNPEGRLAAHRRDARNLLGCEDCREWLSPDHEEGALNERALIAWCREHAGGFLGEYFFMDFDRVVAFACSLPMTPLAPPTSAPRAPGSVYTDMAEDVADAISVRALRALIGAESLQMLEYELNPDYPLPEIDPNRAEHWPEDAVAAIRSAQSELGMGTSRLELIAGIVITRIQIATERRLQQAIEAERDDLTRDILP